MKIQLREDCNGIRAGKRYIKAFDIIVEGSCPVETDEISHETKDNEGEGQCHLIKYPNDIYRYGYEAYQDKDKPGHGGWWSSSAGAISEEFGINLIEVIIDHYSGYAVPIKVVKPLIPEGYEIYTSDSYGTPISQVVLSEELAQALSA